LQRQLRRLVSAESRCHCAPLRTSVVVHLDAQPLKNDRPSQARSTSWWPEADLFAVQGCCGREATFGCYKPGATWERRFRFGNRRGSMINSVERDGRCRPGLPLPLLFAPVILVTALLVVWPGWLRTAQAQSWVSEEGGGVRHIVVTINKSRTLRFDKPFASAVVGAAGEDPLHHGQPWHPRSQQQRPDRAKRRRRERGCSRARRRRCKRSGSAALRGCRPWNSETAVITSLARA